MGRYKKQNSPNPFNSNTNIVEYNYYNYRAKQGISHEAIMANYSEKLGCFIKSYKRSDTPYEYTPLVNVGNNPRYYQLSRVKGQMIQRFHTFADIPLLTQPPTLPNETAVGTIDLVDKIVVWRIQNKPTPESFFEQTQ